MSDPVVCSRWEDFPHELLITLVAELAAQEELHGIKLAPHLEGHIRPLYNMVARKENLIFDIGFELISFGTREDIDFDDIEFSEEASDLYAAGLFDALENRIKCANLLKVKVVVSLEYLRKIHAGGQKAVCQRLADRIVASPLKGVFSIAHTDNFFLEDAYKIMLATTKDVVYP